ISREELTVLERNLEPYSASEIAGKLKAIFRKKQDEELMLDQMSLSYTLAVIPQIAIRIKHALEKGTVDKIFITTKEFAAEDTFEDGIPMDDDKLRLFIDKLNTIRITSEKIAIIKDTVRSQADLLELLDVCFYGDEYKEVLASF